MMSGEQTQSAGTGHSREPPTKNAKRVTHVIASGLSPLTHCPVPVLSVTSITHATAATMVASIKARTQKAAQGTIQMQRTTRTNQNWTSFGIENSRAPILK